MSAWLVDRLHIDVLVNELLLSETVQGDPDAIGRELWGQNLASVAHRYPADGSGERPGPEDLEDDEITGYTWTRPPLRPHPEALAQMLLCLQYQSCEHRGWVGSDAARWVGDLLLQLQRGGHVHHEYVPGLPGWGVDAVEPSERGWRLAGTTLRECADWPGRLATARG